MKSSSVPTFTFPEIRVVEASAGSGKTYALAKRYVQLLLNPALPHEALPMRDILAITFTNKAALEMKSRILDFLKRMALGLFTESEENEILRPIGLSRSSARAPAFAAMEEVIHNYNFFQVQTIDSFIKSLLAGCAFKVGLSGGFKIQRNSRDYLNYSLDALVDQAERDSTVRKLFERFLNQYIFLENKSGWFPKKDIQELLGALFREGNIYGEDFALYDLKGDDLLERKRRILGAMRRLLEWLPEGADKRFRKSLEDFLKEYKQAFDTNRIPDWFKREDVPLNKGTAEPPGMSFLWGEIRRDLQDLAEAEAYSLFNPYIEIFQQTAVFFQEKVVADDVIFLEELNRKARALFSAGAVTVEEIYYRLATRVRHYLIDEFQDTSRLQWHNIVLLTDEALSTGGSFFYVGDKKQAIYRFRGGDARLFDEVQVNKQGIPVSREQLAINYRSQKIIVDFNNQIFSLENLRRFIQAKAAVEGANAKGDLVYVGADAWRELENVFGHSQQRCLPDQDGGYVRVERLEADTKEERQEILRGRILETIAELKTRYPFSSMAVLTRSNSEIEEITSWLLEEGYPVESERTLSIKDHPIVGNLLDFLRFLNSPIDNLAFARFIGGEVFGQAAGWDTGTAQQFLYSLRPRITGESSFYIYKVFRDAYPELWDKFFDEFFRNVGLYPLYELAVSIVHRFGVLQHFPRQQGFVMRLLELIKEKEDETNELSIFLELLTQLPEDEFFVHVTETGSIKVTTIHKAKGLEFPVVIIPSLGMRVQVGTGGGIGPIELYYGHRGWKSALTADQR